MAAANEVHAADVAAACATLLSAPMSEIAGEAFNCCAGYIAQHAVATLAKELSGSAATIVGEASAPRHNIECGKLNGLGFRFNPARLRQTVAEMLASVRSG